MTSLAARLKGRYLGRRAKIYKDMAVIRFWTDITNEDIARGAGITGSELNKAIQAGYSDVALNDKLNRIERSIAQIKRRNEFRGGRPRTDQ